MSGAAWLSAWWEAFGFVMLLVGKRRIVSVRFFVRVASFISLLLTVICIGHANVQRVFRVSRAPLYTVHWAGAAGTGWRGAAGRTAGVAPYVDMCPA